MRKIIKLSALFKQLVLLLKGVEKQSLLTLVILLFQGITQGVGLLFIIPLLSIVGVSENQVGTNEITSSIEALFSIVDIPINLITILCLYLGILLFYALLKYFQSIYATAIRLKISHRWRNHLFKRLNYSSWASIQRNKVSDLQEILTIETRKLGAIINSLINLTSGTILVIIYLTLSLFLSYQLTLLSAIPLGAMLLINRPLNKKTYKIGQSSITHSLGIQAIVHECLGALKLVKSYAKEKKQVDRFAEISHELEHQSLLFTKASSATKLIYEVMAAVIITIYIYLALVIIDLPIAQLLLLILIFSRLLPRVSSITSNFQQLLTNFPAFEIILKTDASFDNPDKDTQNENTTPIYLREQIRFTNVSFAYRKKTIFSNFNATIQANQTTLILGPSGTGKSTLIDLILGIRTIQGGEIYIDQQPYTSLNQKGWKEQIGYVPQDAFLFHETIFNNMEWAKDGVTEEEVWNVLKQVSAYEFVKNLAEGIHTVVGERGSQISGGERQRIVLARALLRKPQLLILDEATNAIDDYNESLIKKTLQQLNGKMTIIFVAHRSELIELADQVIRID